MARLGRSQPAAPLILRPVKASAESGDISAAGSLSITGAAALNATGALLAAGSLSVTGIADLDASGSLAAAGSLSISGAADLDAFGSLVAAGSVSISGAADLDATGSLVAAGSLSISGAADLTGLGGNDLAASGSLSITGSASLSAIGQLLATGSIVITGSAELGPIAEPESTQKPAGRSKRRRKLLVQIDGRDFEVSSAHEAVELLTQAKALVVAQVERAREAPTRINPGLKRPRISTRAPELKQVVAEAREQIVDLYDDFRRELEIRALMSKAQEDDEEETLIRFLM